MSIDTEKAANTKALKDCKENKVLPLLLTTFFQNFKFLRFLKQLQAKMYQTHKSVTTEKLISFSSQNCFLSLISQPSINMRNRDVTGNGLFFSA